MITSSQFNTNACECGIPLTFTNIRPLKEKLADVINIQSSNFIVTLTTKVRHSISVGDSIEIISGGNINNAVVGKHIVTAKTDNTVSFNLRISDRVGVSAVAYIYSVPNIENTDRYIIKFSRELSVPASADVVFSPSVYEIRGGNNFTPQTVVNIKSLYTTSSKTIIKLSITNIFGTVLYTEYKEIVCSKFLDKPCEIVATKPITQSFIYLNRKNNWTYKHNGYLIAQYIPNKQEEYTGTTIRLLRLNNALLPASSASIDRLVLKIDPLLIQNYGLTKDQVKAAILENPISTVLQKNISVEDTLTEWIIESSGLTIDNLKNIVILRSNNNTVVITVNSIGSVYLYEPSPHPIPSLMFLHWSDNNFRNYFLGQFIYNNVYENQDMIVKFKNNNITYKINAFASPEIE